MDLTNIAARVRSLHLTPTPKVQARPGPGQIWEIWGPGNPEILDPHIKKMEIIKLQIRSAQNVGKVWIRRKNT